MNLIKKTTALIIIPTFAWTHVGVAELCKNMGHCSPDHNVDTEKLLSKSSAAATSEFVSYTFTINS
jgi:hypothetical protein